LVVNGGWWAWKVGVGEVVPVIVVGFEEGNIVAQIKTNATDSYNKDMETKTSTGICILFILSSHFRSKILVLMLLDLCVLLIILRIYDELKMNMMAGCLREENIRRWREGIELGEGRWIFGYEEEDDEIHC
jgi:hypothetical protein